MNERRELKYLIPIQYKDQIIKFLKHFCSKDPHAKDNSYYEILSTYYDSPDFRAYAEKINGERNRVKLRIRSYGKDNYKNIELKRKFEEITIKGRI